MPSTLSFFDVKPILSSLRSGAVVLTPNQRLASRITNAYSIYCYQHNERVVVKPSLYSLNNWVESCWRQLLMSANPLATGLKPLSSTQELIIWEQIISQSDLGAVLLRPSATAQQAVSAYQILVDWGLDPSSDEIAEQFDLSEDSKVFKYWAEQFDTYCAEHQWLPAAKISSSVLEAFNQGLLASVGPILTVGFELIPPLQKSLLHAAGQLTVQPINDRLAVVNVVECDSEVQEVQAAAIWAKQKLKHNLDARVAIVVPELAQKREWVQRLLLETFEADYNQPITNDGETNQRNSLPFNLSSGYPLIDAPVINVAIDIISQALPVMELSRLEALCQSPFIVSGINDVELGSRLIKSLSAQHKLSLNTTRFRQLATKIDGDNQWSFAQSLQTIASICRKHSIHNERSRKQWATLFSEILGCFDWPGPRALDSTEFQQVKQWQLAVEEFIKLDLVIETISLPTAISQLKGVLSRIIFQPQTAESPLQVLGTLEAAGLQFTDLWLCAMSERQWPSAPSPHPLLPYSLQKLHDMPHASAERELQFSTEISRRFLHSADNVVVSSALLIDDNPVAVSRIFIQYPRKTIEQIIGRKLSSMIPLAEIRRRHQQSQQLENYLPGNAPRLDNDQKIGGGSGLFANQSACPFKAFAVYRLKQKALEKPQLGLSASDRGSLLHHALELIWKKLKNQHTLLCSTEDELVALCDDCSRYAVTQLSQRETIDIGKRYQALETERLKKLLLKWLDVEKQRASFSVDVIESKKTFQFDCLKLEARIDRIDKLEDGSQLIIDYKSSKSSINRWWGDRPDEPQLPLYNLLADNEQTPVSAVAFAQVRSDGCSLKGVGDSDSPEKFVRWQDKYQNASGVQDWQQLKNSWKTVLTSLATDFINGKADVDPKQPIQSCQYCDLTSLCRIDHKVSLSTQLGESDNDASC